MAVADRVKVFFLLNLSFDNVGSSPHFLPDYSTTTPLFFKVGLVTGLPSPCLTNGFYSPGISLAQFLYTSCEGNWRVFGEKMVQRWQTCGWRRLW
jgi:hypothetical protein